jgi:hypothetical protein
LELVFLSRERQFLALFSEALTFCSTFLSRKKWNTDLQSPDT